MTTHSDDSKTFYDLDAFIVGEIVAKLDPRDRVAFAATNKEHWNEYGKNTIPKTFPHFNPKHFSIIFEKNEMIEEYMESKDTVIFNIDTSHEQKYIIQHISIPLNEEQMQSIEEWLWDIYETIFFLSFVDDIEIIKIEIKNAHLELYIEKAKITIVYNKTLSDDIRFVISTNYDDEEHIPFEEQDNDLFFIDSIEKHFWFSEDSLPEDFIMDCMGLILRIPWFYKKEYEWELYYTSIPKDNYTQNLPPHLRNRVVSWWYQRDKYIYFS